MKLKTGNELHEVSPHIMINRSTKVIMHYVVLAMIPALLGSIYFFGINALILVVSAVTTCVLSEYIWQRIKKGTADYK